MCCGVSFDNLGANLTAAAAVYEHTARCLCDFASNPDFGMKRFAASVLAKSAGWDNAARKANAFNASKMALSAITHQEKTHLVGKLNSNDYH
jgi:hypothetical protein